MNARQLELDFYEKIVGNQEEIGYPSVFHDIFSIYTDKSVISVPLADTFTERLQQQLDSGVLGDDTGAVDQ